MGNVDLNDFASLGFGLLVFLLLMVAYGAGLVLRRWLPAAHQTHESLEIVHAVIGMLVAMVAIVLGLQLNSTTESFNDLAKLVDRYSVQIIQLDALLRDYGPGAQPVRAKLTEYTEGATRRLEEGDISANREQGAALRAVSLQLLQLVPADAVQSRVQADGLALINELFQERWQLIAGARLEPNLWLYAVLLFWLVLIYGAFGMNARFNTPVFVVLLVSGLSLGMAIFVLADMSSPFDGLIAISPRPMQEAVARLIE